MKRSTVAIGIIVLLILVGGGILIANHNNKNGGLYGSNNSANASTANTPQNTTSNSSSTSNAPQATNAVSIQNFAFSPEDITVKAGTKVTWTNNDSTTHTVTETDDLPGPKSGDLNPGSSYSFTFTKAGTYHYHCSIHTDMSGTVTVN